MYLKTEDVVVLVLSEVWLQPSVLRISMPTFPVSIKETHQPFSVLELLINCINVNLAVCLLMEAISVVCQLMRWCVKRLQASYCKC